MDGAIKKDVVMVTKVVESASAAACLGSDDVGDVAGDAEDLIAGFV